MADSKVSDERLAELISEHDGYDNDAYIPHSTLRMGALVSLLRELQQLRAGWRDIATAPRDGLHILLYRPRIQSVGYYSESGWCINAPGLPLMLPPPTHWMPKPQDPPSQERADG